MSSPRANLNLVDALLSYDADELTKTLIEIYNNAKGADAKTTEANLLNRFRDEFKNEDLGNKERYLALSLALGTQMIHFGLWSFNKGKLKMDEGQQPEPQNTEEKAEAKSYGPLWAPEDKRAGRLLSMLVGFIPTLTTSALAMDPQLMKQMQEALLENYNHAGLGEAMRNPGKYF